jgi:iron complex transport system ATP-binding protein
MRVSGLSVSLAGQPVLRNITFDAGTGEFVALVGPNGAGKTTLLRALAGVLPEAPHLKPDPRRVAYVPQGAGCAWGLTLRQVVALGRLPHRDADGSAVDAALRSCGVWELADRRIDQVSGGQARRAMLARAMAATPRVLLLDEPVADLDPPACHDVMRLLARFVREGGTVVAVLHALDLAAAYATRLVVLSDGAIVADGPPASALPTAAGAFGMRLEPGHVPLLSPFA